ncbi:MAG: ribonuclease HII [Lachnospiraceae bacterium]|nr:ribonuclease HII [Lachnospiraceae bacterium]
MSESVSEIKKKFGVLSDDELQGFIETYSADPRSGVQSIVNTAKKRILALENEKKRMFDMFSFEREYGECRYICGIDEVGRGPLAGPVVAAAVILPKDCDILYINDSKKLSPKKREELSREIREKALSYGIGKVDEKRIDEINILNATYEAMRDAINNLSIKPDIILNDAVTIPGVNIRQIPIIKGDAKSASIAAASIVAKVERDAFMTEMDSIYPGYGFASNKGYGSEDHITALKKYGPTPIHRKSYITKFI